jgi:hypothetical protein
MIAALLGGNVSRTEECSMNNESDDTKLPGPSVTGTAPSDGEPTDLPVIGIVGMELVNLAMSQSQTLMDSVVRATKCRSPQELMGLTTHFWEDALRQQLAASTKIAGMLTPSLLKTGKIAMDRAADQLREHTDEVEKNVMSEGEMGGSRRGTFDHFSVR